ncbi:exodeoxyribonuclease V subunit alpha [Buchnera aphidicola (Mollitrichosiphum nigrofasciatum)]|uniref:exodeoxyribonuclease V subunit alpha n=1 Tax=Buchnera aphidicola TaxID=9 RepID=UPI0031B8139D
MKEKIFKTALKKKKINLTSYYFILFLKKKKKPEINFILYLLIKLTQKGNICLPIKKIIKKNKLYNNYKKLKKKKKIKKMLLNSDICSKGEKIKPLIIFKNNIYLYRMWSYEKNISNFFLKNEKKISLKYKQKEILINYLIKNHFNKKQKKTIIKTLTYNKTIIIGGPGTGKTTIVGKIIIILIKIQKKKQKIILSAPTAKATLVLKKKFNKIIKNSNLKKRETNKIKYKARTLHYILGIKKNSQKPLFNKKRKINANILIIDETSMIDFFIMNYLIHAISKKTKIILLGDPNQIEPINSSSFFNNICKYMYKENTKEKTSTLITNKNYNINKINYSKTKICKLTTNFRFNKTSEINKLSQIILEKKKSNKKIKKFIKKKNKNIKFIKIKKISDYKKIIKQIIKYYHNIKNEQEFKKYRILCTIKKGPFGTKKINKYIEYYIIKKKPYKKINNFIIYDGKPIMITKNNPILNLFNGEIGIIKIINNNIIVFFKNKKIPLYNINNYETTWCTTIHKSQGSEFENIYIILPNLFKKKITKKLIYTAITRAKKKITICGNKKIFIKICKNKLKRYCGLINYF